MFCGSRFILLAAGVLFVMRAACAEIFTPNGEVSSGLQQAIDRDSSGAYYQTPGLERRRPEKSLSGYSEQLLSSALQDNVLLETDDSFQKEYASELRKRVDESGAADSSLVFLSYTSPAIADVIKHQRMMVQARLMNEELRMDLMEQSIEDDARRLRLLSRKHCMQDNQGLGLVGAAEKCRRDSNIAQSLPPILGKGASTGGVGGVHVVRHSFRILGVTKNSDLDQMLPLSGELIVDHNVMKDVLPGTTFAGHSEVLRQRLYGTWQTFMQACQQEARLDDKALDALSLPAVPLSLRVCQDLAVLNKDVREIYILKSASILARAAAGRDYRKVIILMHAAEAHPGIPGVYRRILRNKRESLERLLPAGSMDEGTYDADYKTWAAALKTDADTARLFLLGK